MSWVAIGHSPLVSAMSKMAARHSNNCRMSRAIALGARLSAPSAVPPEKDIAAASSSSAQSPAGGGATHWSVNGAM